ncbi:RES family NAD+ phosphorylase [Solirubrobacter ginsenosidimutans]|uniref:RES family NAD+ phosphorylase n=1 Tax=Solirubrobacter ginsenosidimutans TaxID=490573 RepID=A0A9X3S5X7_9ACTN|nr:RES family NAD+ phosphorylase [Solirubrobacter ginsenosidimutans]MDA0166067.1 RES family NAD+ phosphorylase [Solirubrobacter ginsenosidimutans]
MIYEPIAAGTELVRVHHRRFAPDEFSTPRRLPFGPPVIPTLDAARDDATAIAEAQFHDVPPGGDVPRAALEGRVLTRLRATRALQLIMLSDPSLLEAPASDYAHTAEVAKRLHDDAPAADGIAWASRHFPAQRALVLFGDRIADLIALSRPLPLDRGAGLLLAEEVAMRADVGLLL